MTADFRHQLACTGRADEMCVDSSNPHQRQRRETEAKAICATCPLLERCRAWVMAKADDPSPVMVVGGMTPGERRREKFGTSNCGTESGYTLHRRKGSKPCPACVAAHNQYNREQKRAWRAKKRNDERKGAA